MRKLYISLLLLLSMHASAQCRLSSPDGLNEVIVSQKSDEFVNSVSHGGKAIVSDSRLGLDLDNYTWERALARNYPQYDCWMNGFSVDSVTTTMNRSVITNLWGEQAVVPDNYNAATLHLSKHDGSNYRMDIEVRAYNEGIAFRRTIYDDMPSKPRWYKTADYVPIFVGNHVDNIVFSK